MRATYFDFLACVVVISAVASAQAIQKWKTPDGKLYFGDKPPAGSTKIGGEGSNEPSFLPFHAHVLLLQFRRTA